MACYSPLHGFKGEVTPEGKRPIVWKRSESDGGERCQLPCGKCLGCRMTYAKGWAIRCMHERQMHEDSCFVTLTFDEKHLPPGGFCKRCDADMPEGSVHVCHVQLFMKRLRKECGRVRYFFAGEYGGKFGRPHYHGLLFGLDFPDKVLKSQRMGNCLYESAVLGKLWPFGFHSIGDVSFKSASYVARYCTKKATEVATSETYRDADAGERFLVDKRSGLLKRAEFTVMSRRPGIGASWFDRFESDVFPSDEVIFNGQRMRPPRFYDNLLDKHDPDLLESLKLVRAQRVDFVDNTQERLDVKQEVALANLKHFKRTLED